ncbi:alpha-ketoglutarate-dependent dioxygenase AlkB family protein [Cecembia calidifontis]|jgi:alkylated DNA repair dioxygenase AlkB|uniref:Alkylated DNA repair dioxygenase AlkB n=1 Tax=Cecembia calidifontis TaxID=1187080 RepID=A0A4Q7PE02_9BACT|nr:alpha-ketoglutarate-dependent dioxygenase AlkB [Cecembia calidifontis]RZS97998.1 alkylated DNA repair dioxygenase AlkB [Cecembia calidifontis]
MDLFGDFERKNILPEKGEAYYYQNFFSPAQSDLYLKRLIEEISWKQEPIWMFGKQVMQPRLTAFYGNPGVNYGYSGIQMKPYPWNEVLLEIKNDINKASQTQFTHVLLNYYRDGQDSMGWHRDNEPELGLNPAIGSVSFGASRIFQFRLYHDKTVKREVLLEHGSFLLMAGETQHYWEHQIPKSKKVYGPRINLTFRRIQ